MGLEPGAGSPHQVPGTQQGVDAFSAGPEALIAQVELNGWPPLQRGSDSRSGRKRQLKLAPIGAHRPLEHLAEHLDDPIAGVDLLERILA